MPSISPLLKEETDDEGTEEVATSDSDEKSQDEEAEKSLSEIIDAYSE
jgi:hypothetical protein